MNALIKIFFKGQIINVNSMDYDKLNLICTEIEEEKKIKRKNIDRLLESISNEID